jgi:hypothetical protein
VTLPVILVVGGVWMEFMREAASSGRYDWGFLSIIAFFVFFPTASILQRVIHPLGAR